MAVQILFVARTSDHPTNRGVVEAIINEEEQRARDE
jgi:hypothetical protein